MAKVMAFPFRYAAELKVSSTVRAPAGTGTAISENCARTTSAGFPSTVAGALLAIY